MMRCPPPQSWIESHATVRSSRSGAEAEKRCEEGVRLAQQGRLDEAIASFHAALQHSPDYAKAHHNLAVALAERDRLDDAIRHMQTALQLQPGYVEAHYNLGSFYLQMRNIEAAVASYRQVLARRPDHADALNNLGLCLTQLGRPEEAVILLKHLVRLKPDFVAGYNNLGLAHTALGESDDALAAFEQALRLQPLYAEAHANAANVYKARGELAKALASYDLALLLEPKSVTTRWNRSLTLLQMGNYEAGWPEYESRRAKPNSGIRPFREALWDGSPLAGRRILVHIEQGFGDMLQGIRLATLVQRSGGHVLVTCPEKLLPLFRLCPDIDQLIDERDALPPFDVHAPLWSLPAMLKTTLASVPAEVPYLHADPALIDRWRGPVQSLAGFKVGIAWQGNPLHSWDRHRSVPLRHFASLAELDGVRLVSLQKGHGVEQIQQNRPRFEVIELCPDLDDTTGMFMDTAAIMKHLDLVITVDTSIAHLAGGLGIRTWIVLSTITDWRWLQDRDSSPWYPTVRLFRQDRLGAWPEVFAEMVRELRKLAPCTK